MKSMTGTFNESRASKAGRLAALQALMLFAIGAMICPPEARAWTGQPLLYVSNGDGTISVIDTGSNLVVDTITAVIPRTIPNGPAPKGPARRASTGPVPATDIYNVLVPPGIAVAPDGSHVYAVELNGPLGSYNFETGLSVIDTANQPYKVATTIQAVQGPGLAMAPGGDRIYVVGGSYDGGGIGLSVIDAATNKVVANLPACGNATAIAVTPDGNYLYVSAESMAHFFDVVCVVDTRTQKVVAQIPVPYPQGIAVTPDGQHVYVGTNAGLGYVDVIATATNKVEASVSTGDVAEAIAISPDGQHVYCAGQISVSVIATATNTVEATIPTKSTAVVYLSPTPGIAITPDGKHVYVTRLKQNSFSNVPNSVLVIDTATNTVVGPEIPVGQYTGALAIIPPPQGVPFLAGRAALDIHFGPQPQKDDFDLKAEFTLSSQSSNGVHPDAVPVKIEVGPFVTTIPAGSFTRRGDGSYAGRGIIDGVSLEGEIKQTGTLRYALTLKAKGANMTGATNPVQVSLAAGGYAGLTSVTAHIEGQRAY